jgi:hypothetical protein
VTISTTHFQIAHGLAHNQLVFGVGARFVAMSLRGTDSERASFTSTGNGLEFGVVWKPEQRPLRLGAALRTSIRTEASYRENLLPNANGDIVVPAPGTEGVYLPKAVAFPWDLNVGFAVQLGARPFNPPWRTDGELIERETLAHRMRELDREEERTRAVASAKTPEEREEIRRRFARDQRADDERLDRALLDADERIERELTRMNRFYVQVAGSVVLSGPVDNAVGVESLVTQVVSRSGKRPVVSLRLGVESGVVPTLLKVRAGTYLEPTRFDDGSPRLHATAGLDIKLIRWNVFGMWPDDYMWRLGLGGDAARNYYTWGLTIGGWYPRHVDSNEVASSPRFNPLP